MSPEEAVRRAFRDVPTARIASLDPTGAPHVAPRWFVWLEDAIYLSTGKGGRTWANVEHDPRVCVLIDRGREWVELTGVQIDGTGEILPVEHPDVRDPMSAWHEKYRAMLAADGFEAITEAVPSLGFVRVEPSRLRTWDHAEARHLASP